MSKKASRQKDLTKKVLCSLLAAGVLSVGLPMGEVLAAEFIGQTVENQQHSGWGNLQREDLTISGSTYQHNTNEDADGPAGGALSTYSASKQLTVTISDSTFAFNKAVTTSEKQDIGSGALGGAMVIKGSKLTLTDVDFHNNTVETSTGKAFAAGGAIYLDATINGNNKFPTEAKIIATKNITYAGNDVVGNGADVWYANTYGALAQSSGGFMFLDRNASAEFSVADGATLTIGNADATGNMDSIASAIPLNVTDGNKYAELSKTGVGTLTINSDLNKYYGTLNVADGTMNVNKDWTVKNTVTVNGGILNMADVTLDKIPQTITAIAPNGTEEEYTLANPATGEIIVDGGTVNANNIDATNGSVTLKKGALNVEETYTGDILATDGTSNVTAATLTGNLLAKNGGQLTVDLGTGTLTANGTGEKNQDFSRGIRAIVNQKGDRSAATIKIQAGNVNATSEKVSAIQAAITWVGDGESISSALAPVIDITTDNLTARSEKEAAVTGQDGNVLIKATNKVTLTTGADSTMGVVYARNHSNDKAMGIVSIEAKTIEILAENADAKAISGNTRGEVNVKASEAVTIKGSIASYNKDMQNDTSGITIDVSGAKVTASGKEINAADDSAVTITGGKGSSLEYVDIIAAAQDKENKSTKGGKINIDFADGGSIEGAVTAQNGGHITMTGADISGMVKVTGTDSGLTVNSGTVEFDAPSVDYAGGSEYRHAALFVSDGAKAEYGTKTVIDKMVFNSANATTNSSSNTPGTAYNAAVVTGGSTLDINAKELYVGSQAQGGDRGFRLTGEGNTLNITADKIVSYTGDEFVHVRKGATNKATITVGDFEAHTTWGKDDYGVAMLQVNEGGAIDFTADTAVFDGSTNAAGGVFGSGSWGNLNVTANEKLTIDGNICGTYGQLVGDNHANTKFILNVTAKDLDMKGDINAGNMGAGYSKHDRQTEVTVKVTETGKLVGNINAYKQGTIDVDLGQGSIDGNVTADAGSTIGLGGTITFDGSKTSFTTATDGIINLTSGIMDGSLNIADGSKVNLTGATFKAADLATALTGAGTLTLKGNGILETVAGQVFTVDDTKLTANDLTNNAVNENAKDKVVFDSGTLKLTDAEYTLDYVTSASGALKTADSKTNSKTNILMSGKLVEGGEVKDEISIDQAAGLGDDILLDEVVVRDDSKNILIGTTLNHGVGESTTVGSVTINKDSKTVANGFSAAQLDLGAASTGVVLTNNETLNLGGSKGGDLVTVGGTTTDDGVKLVIGTESAIGTATETAGTLNIGAFTAPQTDNKLTGSITVNDSSTVNVVNGNLEVTKGVTLAGGTVNVGNGVLTSDVTVTTGASTLTGAAQVGTLTAAAGATLNLGAEDQAAKVAVANLALNGGTLFLDPIWKDGATQDQGTEITVADDDVDGKLIVGQNSTLSLGTDDKGKAREVFAKSGLTWNDSDTLAAVYVASPITLKATGGTEGGLYVDPTAVSGTSVNDNSVTFNNGSVLMVDGTAVTGTAAISGVTGGVTVGDEAKLYIDGAKKGEEYKILAGTSLNTGTVWQDENIISDNKLLKFTGDATTDNNAFDVTAALQKVNQVFNDQVVIGNVVDASLAGDKADAAQNFFNNAVSSKYNATDADAVNALNSVANMGELAGVSRGTYSMSNIMTDAVSKHLSLANHAEADKDIWAHYIHSKEEVRDMEMGGMSGSYDMKYNGIVVGGDFYNKGKATAGVALSYAKGDVDSIGNSVTTKNDAEYYGLSLYGRINNGDSSVLGDISYLHGKNDITQNNSGTKITASPKSDAFSMGVKAEKAYDMGAGKLVPYAGLRYLHLGVGDYSNSLGMHYNADDQNMWLLPVGVTYSYETKAGDWTIRPLVEAGYVWTAGDRDTKQTVSLNGASDGFGFNVADSGSFVGRFALEAEKANIAFGLGYEYQKGDSVKANRLMANVRFSF